MFVIFFEGSDLQDSIFNSYVFTSVGVILQFSIVWFSYNFKNPIFQIVKIFDESRNRPISSRFTLNVQSSGFTRLIEGSTPQVNRGYAECETRGNSGIWYLEHTSTRKYGPLKFKFSINVLKPCIWRKQVATFGILKWCLKGTQSVWVKVIIEMPLNYRQLGIKR